MELFLFRHAEYERLYNCTGLDIDSIPLERRQFVPESIVVCVLCAIYYHSAEKQAEITSQCSNGSRG
uniref:Uncharacterized protein n=1 Tax=Globodera pallida TaxID=36090 RepID=A0A183BQF1_GLOPA